MNAIVYLNTALSVFAPCNLFSVQKHFFPLLLRFPLSLKNTRLPHLFRYAACHYGQRYRVADGKQSAVFVRFMRGVQ